MFGFTFRIRRGRKIVITLPEAGVNTYEVII